MPVSFIIISINFIICKLSTAFCLNNRRLSLLLGKYCSYSQLSELHFRFKSKKTITASNKSTCKRKSNIACLNFFKDLIFLSSVLKFSPVFEFKHCIGIVIYTELHLVTYCTGDVHLNFFLEIECWNCLEFYRKSRILGFGNP